MTLLNDLDTIADELDRVADRPSDFTKAQMAKLMRASASVLRDLKIIIGKTPDYGLDKIDPQGRA